MCSNGFSVNSFDTNCEVDTNILHMFVELILIPLDYNSGTNHYFLGMYQINLYKENRFWKCVIVKSVEQLENTSSWFGNSSSSSLSALGIFMMKIELAAILSTYLKRLT